MNKIKYAVQNECEKRLKMETDSKTGKQNRNMATFKRKFQTQIGIGKGEYLCLRVEMKVLGAL